MLDARIAVDAVSRQAEFLGLTVQGRRASLPVQRHRSRHAVEKHPGAGYSGIREEFLDYGSRPE